MHMKQTVQETAKPALQDTAIFDGNGLKKKYLRSLEKSRNSGILDHVSPEFRVKTSQGLTCYITCSITCYITMYITYAYLTCYITRYIAIQYNKTI